jgi:nickel-dependent lactate racemase
MAPIRVRWGAWFGDTDFELAFPDGWDVTRCASRDGEDIGPAGVADAFAHPIGSPRLRDLAVGRRSACIVIDDLSRPTRGDRLIPPILDELSAAGIGVEDVLVLLGVANHRPVMREDMTTKLGAEVMERCRVRNHFSWARCADIGVTSRGTLVQLNEDFLASDLKILVGSIVPHPAAGFSGGAKLVLPAVASIESAKAFHTGLPGPGDKVGVVETTARVDAEEAAIMAGVDFIVNSVPTTHKGIAGLVTGDLVTAHRVGVGMAQRVYATSAPRDADVCVLSAYPKDNEFLQYSTAFAPLHSAPAPLVRPGGTVVVASAGSEGQGFHALFGPGMALWHGAILPGGDAELVLFSPGIRPGDLEPDLRQQAPLFATWDETMRWLVAKHGQQATASVFPSAVTQLVDAVYPSSS